jgi:hypothetical protein
MAQRFEALRSRDDPRSQMMLCPTPRIVVPDSAATDRVEVAVIQVINETPEGYQNLLDVVLAAVGIVGVTDDRHGVTVRALSVPWWADSGVVGEAEVEGRVVGEVLRPIRW